MGVRNSGLEYKRDTVRKCYEFLEVQPTGQLTASLEEKNGAGRF